MVRKMKTGGTKNSSRFHFPAKEILFGGRTPREIAARLKAYA